MSQNLGKIIPGWRAVANTLEAGSSASATVTQDLQATDPIDRLLTLNIPRGANGLNGTNGVDGADGVSISSVTETTTTAGHDVTVTLDNGTVTTFTVYDGLPGAQGPQGPKGETGTGVAIKASAADCTEIGDAYIEQTPGLTYGHLMILTALPSTFTDGGEIKGPKGDTGEQGVGIEQVIQTQTQTGSNKEQRFKFKLTNGTFTDEVVVYNGQTGAQGPAGAQGRGISRLTINSFGELLVYYTDDQN